MMKRTSKLPGENDKEIIRQDRFNNKVTINKLDDGTFRKVTQTNKDAQFEFQGDAYSYSLLNSAIILKVYWDEDHSERKLVKDKYGRLFHYRYDEEMNFDGENDRLDLLWTLVANEEDSDALSRQKGLSLLREPYVASAEINWVAANEYIN